MNTIFRERAQGSDAQAFESGCQEYSLLRRFWRLRFWPAWWLLGWMRITAMLNYRVALTLYKGLGLGFWALSARRRRVVQSNLRICFPALSSRKRQQLVLRHFMSLGAGLAETAMAWFSSPAKLAAMFEFEGRENLTDALDAGRGVILYGGHFTTVEICASALRLVTSRAVLMGHKRRNPLLSEVQRRARERFSDAFLDKHDSRQMMRCLTHNAVVWFAPDQACCGKRGQLIDFFGEPAMTNTSTSSFARLSGAKIVTVACRRDERRSKYVIRFSKALEKFPGNSTLADSKRLVAHLEAAIAMCPEQYLWTHRRFRDRPAPYADVYSAGTASVPAR